MACALTQDFNLDCRDSIGGVKEVYIIEIGNVSAVTEASGVVSAITKSTGKFFRKYSLIRQTSHFEDTGAISEANGTNFINQTGELIINKKQANTRNEVMLLAKNNLAFVVIDLNGKGWLFGREYGLVLGAYVAGTGTAWGDRNGYTLPFAGSEREPSPEVSLSCIATLQTPG